MTKSLDYKNITISKQTKIDLENITTNVKNHDQLIIELIKVWREES